MQISAPSPNSQFDSAAINVLLRHTETHRSPHPHSMIFRPANT